MFGDAAFSDAPFSALRTLEVGGIPTAARSASAPAGGNRNAAALSTGSRTAAPGETGSRTAGARRKD